jgi:hypothetical protein
LEDNGDVVLEGRFFKRGEARSSAFQERHFELTRSTLSYFAKKVS